MLTIYSPQRREIEFILLSLIFLASPETSSLATWMGTTTLMASLWGECLSPRVTSSLSASPYLLSATYLGLQWLVMPAFAIKDSVFRRSQLHRNAVIFTCAASRTFSHHGPKNTKHSQAAADLHVRRPRRMETYLSNFYK